MAIDRYLIAEAIEIVNAKKRAKHILSKLKEITFDNEFEYHKYSETIEQLIEELETCV